MCNEGQSNGGGLGEKCSSQLMVPLWRVDVESGFNTLG